MGVPSEGWSEPPKANFIKTFFSSSLMLQQNKLERLSSERFFQVSPTFESRIGPSQALHLKGRLLTFLANVRLTCKHGRTSLFCYSVTDEGKKKSFLALTPGFIFERKLCIVEIRSRCTRYRQFLSPLCCNKQR
jgi:hypothetical protein